MSINIHTNTDIFMNMNNNIHVNIQGHHVGNALGFHRGCLTGSGHVVTSSSELPHKQKDPTFASEARLWPLGRVPSATAKKCEQPDASKW